MGTLRLAGSFIEITSLVKSYGHLQIVYEGEGVSKEIEVQAPVGSNWALLLFSKRGWVHFA